MSDFAPARVTQRRGIGPSYVALTLEVPSTVARGFTNPGQYHRLSLDGVAAGTFAVASAPGGDHFEYLVKRGGAVTEALASLEPGAQVLVSPMMGRGLPWELAEHRPLLLIAAGTGFAPLRSVLGTIAQRGHGFRRVSGLWGLRREDELAWGDELDAHRAHGHSIAVTLSQPGASWTGLKGRVQSHLASLAVDNAVAFVVGQRDLIAEVKSALAERGLPPERIFTNG